MIELKGRSLISQEILHELEAMCTQEEPPACEAACPLHLDVRLLCSHMKNKEFEQAYKLYAKSIPFASVIAHTCDAPCRGVCKRIELGGSIEIGKLERMLASDFGHPAKPPLLIPEKEEKAAVIGANLTGMTAAVDLCKKGYKVTLFEKEEKLGGSLWEGKELPEEVLKAEIDNLSSFPITIELKKEIKINNIKDAEAFMEEQSFDAVLIACDSDIKANGSDMRTDIPNLLSYNFPRSKKYKPTNKAENEAGQNETGQNNAGQNETGRIASEKPDTSTIHAVFLGRSAATTIDRLLQKVSVDAGRDKEGSFETRLFTDLEGVKAVPTVKGTAGISGNYDPEEAAEEAGRCIQCECMMCVKKCGFMQHYKVYPKKIVREIYNNLSIALGTHYSNEMINSCALCGQCGAICPNGLDMEEVFRAAREQMTATEKMPQSAFEFALLDMDSSLSDDFFTVRHQPGTDSSAYAFFPGCQLAASEPGLTKSAYEDLAERLEGGVGLFLGCCGVMAKWAGNIESFDKAKDKLTDGWGKLGRPVLISGCPTCTITLNEIGKEMGIKVLDIYSILNELGISDQKKSPAVSELRLHHACGARHRDILKNDIKDLASDLGIAVTEKNTDEDRSPCCGYGGLVPVSNEPVSDEITDTALDQMQDMPTLTYCVNCRDRYLHKGRDSYHLLELIYNDTEAERTWPTWSRRQDNRVGLKRVLLEELWGEKLPELNRMKLFIDDKLSEKLEHTHILESDIGKAIELAEENGEKMLRPDTGHFLTCYRPANVTFWVEYAPEKDGWRIYNAYSHRIRTVLTSELTSAKED